MSSEDAWRPAAALDTLRLRAQLLAAVRDFFAARGVLEVDTPILSGATVSDVHLESLATPYSAPDARESRPLYLQTSPEYAMKRLLAAGSGDIYQVCKVFRDGERSRQHNPEFTMIEWYRLGFDLPRLMQEVDALLRRLLAQQDLAPTEFVSYREILQRELGIDVRHASLATLVACAAAQGAVLPPGEVDRDTCLDLLMGVVVGPRLGRGRLTFVYGYPASQAALARLDPADPEVAERFEAYGEGIELCNGFRELSDAGEQRRRFMADQALRASRGLPQRPLDEHFLAALAAGLPDCAGVAVGFDRVLLLAARRRDLDAVLAFPVERA